MLTLYLTQLRNSITSSVAKPRVCQRCRKRNHEGGQHDERGVQSEAQHSTHLYQGSVHRWQRVDRGHVTRPIRGKLFVQFAALPEVGAVVSICSVAAIVRLRCRVPPPFLRHSGRPASYSVFTDAIRIHCLFSAPSGLPSGLKPQNGPQAAKSTRLKASIWCTTRKLRCTPNPAVPLSTQYKRVRSSIRPTVLLRQTRTRVASWRIPIQTPTVLLLRLPVGVSLLPSLRNQVSRVSSSFPLCVRITHELDRLLLCTVSRVWFFSVRPSTTRILLPIDWSHDFDPIFVAKQCAQLVTRQHEQHRYFDARQTRRKLPIRSLRH